MNEIQKIISDAIEALYWVKVDTVELSTPPKIELGDVCYGPFLLARDLKKSPAQISTELLQEVSKNRLIEWANVAGPYLNLKISKNMIKNTFLELYKNQTNVAQIGAGKKVVIDYIGANVGKPLHIGHMCTPNQGQAMINVYKKLWFNVISDSHIGDWGIIFGKLILAYKLWGEESKLKENAVDYLLELYIKITSESEKNTDIEQQTRDEFKLLSEWNPESVELWKKFTSYSIEAMNKNLARLYVKPDFNIGESFYEWLWLPKIENYPDLAFDMHSIVKELIEKKIATKNDDNSVGVDFGDESKIPSCILQKRDGTHGYLASDLAAIKYRTTNWSPEKIIYFVDVRQKLHFEQAFEIAKRAGWIDKTQLFHAYNGFISGKEGAFSTRKWNIIKLSDLLDEAEMRAEKIILEKRQDFSEVELKKLAKIIGIWAIKYGYLSKSRTSDVIFDWDEFMTFEGNSAPYIQYAYVRWLKLLQKSGVNMTWVNLSKNSGNFSSDEEKDLIQELGNFSNILQKTATENFPHILAGYAYGLTKKFNALYNNVHIISEENEENKLLRLALVDLYCKILSESFAMLGIEMPQEM